jgi:hypothetical protein
MMFKEMIADHTQIKILHPYTQNAPLLTIKADGTYTYSSALKG